MGAQREGAHRHRPFHQALHAAVPLPDPGKRGAPRRPPSSPSPSPDDVVHKRRSRSTRRRAKPSRNKTARPAKPLEDPYRNNKTARSNVIVAVAQNNLAALMGQNPWLEEEHSALFSAVSQRLNNQLLLRTYGYVDVLKDYAAMLADIGVGVCKARKLTGMQMMQLEHQSFEAVFNDDA